MTTDAENLKICRIPSEALDDFRQVIINAGSVYFSEADKSLVVGDGETPGGVSFAAASEGLTADEKKALAADLSNADIAGDNVLVNKTQLEAYVAAELSKITDGDNTGY